MITTLNTSMQSLLDIRQRTDSWNWGTDFDNNYKAFADTLAESIAEDALQKLRGSLSNSYAVDLRNGDCLELNYSLDITDNPTAKKITEFAKNTELEPFKTWLKEFSNNTAQVDRKYFRNVMEFIGDEVKVRLQDLLKPLEKNFLRSCCSYDPMYFDVTGCESLNLLSFSNPKNDLKIRFWFRKYEQDHRIPNIVNQRLNNKTTFLVLGGVIAFGWLNSLFRYYLDRDK